MQVINPIEKFQPGVIFVGLRNKRKMKLVEIVNHVLQAPNGRVYDTAKKAIIQDLETGTIFETGYDRLAYCEFKIL